MIIHNKNRTSDTFLYTFACHESEQALCFLELKRLLGMQEASNNSFYITNHCIDPSRSPFLKMRVDILFSASALDELLVLAESIELEEGSTFKVLYLKEGIPYTYEEQRKLERAVGSRIRGTARMKKPDITLGLIHLESGWILGLCHEAESVWLNHKNKPHNYSTGLSTRVARALVNIAAPEATGVTMIDPCCGMGNVLIEALSMGISIRGNDINPLAVQGARKNLRHYGYDDSLVTLGDMTNLEEKADRAILDLPYNVCSVLPVEEQLQLLNHLGKLASEAVIVSTQPIAQQLQQTGWRVEEHVTTSKGSFVREIWYCKKQTENHLRD
ncbi:TRM11 family SAM-dependent methyltransferase [Paenibacillus gallinarum]|uniref:RsmD family RNA methyltransferase n=1 Tax=Paenibacillus gallinarum TaxID=2762232 RepID=A0ABR8SSM0_9BACL|nr:RsmD family RNA methyltransferase [Paenibacillus gallinarum]MBD7966476.1 RsmD family RNA methyltransferase [Paenibacillus gallinarum]